MSRPPDREGTPTFGEFAVEYLRTSLTNNRASTYREKAAAFHRLLVPFFGAMDLGAVGTREIEAYKAARVAAGRHPKTINNEVGHIVALLRYAVECGLLAKAPAGRKIKLPPPEFDFLTFDEADQLVAAAQLEGSPWSAMVLVALRTGLRRSELRALRWTDVDLAAGRLVVRVTLDDKDVETPPKSGRHREIPLSAETRAELQRRRRLGKRVFLPRAPGAERGDCITQRQMERPLQRICQRAGLRNIGWHGLRHTFASHLVMRGVPLAAVQELLGHSTITMTMRYAHLSPDVRRDAVQLLDRGPVAGPSDEFDPQQLRKLVAAVSDLLSRKPQ